jgi:cell division protein FtsB
MTTSVNLLPLRFRQRMLLKRRIREWLPLWILVAAGFGTIGAARYHSLSRTQSGLNELQARCDALRTLERETESMRARLHQLNSRESLLAMLNRPGHPVQLIGLVGSAAGREIQDVQILDFSIAPAPDVLTMPQKLVSMGEQAHLSEVMPPMRLHLAGIGVDDLAVARFVAVLRDSGTFLQVMLKSSSAVGDASGDAREFSAECLYD